MAKTRLNFRCHRDELIGFKMAAALQTTERGAPAKRGEPLGAPSERGNPALSERVGVAPVAAHTARCSPRAPVRRSSANSLSGSVCFGDGSRDGGCRDRDLLGTAIGGAPPSLIGKKEEGKRHLSANSLKGEFMIKR